MGISLRDQLTGFPTVVDIQRAYNWDFLLPDLYGIIVSGMIISKFCQSVRYGQYNISDILEMKVGQEKKFFPNGADIDIVNSTFVTPVPDLVSLYFAKWRSMMMDKFGRYNVSADYKKTGYVILYNRAGIPVNIVRLIGLFPLKFPAFDLSYTEEKEVRFDIDFRIDRIEMGLSALSGLGKDIGAQIGGAVSSVGRALGSLGK